jgi:hypothetical protein
VSTGIGSETQKPLAIVVIGGLMTATVLTLLVFPIHVPVFLPPPGSPVPGSGQVKSTTIYQSAF